MKERKWLVYLLYCVPGIFLALWLEFLYMHTRPIWLFLTQVGLVFLLPAVLACVCGRTGWRKTVWIGNVLGFSTSGILLSTVSATCATCPSEWGHSFYLPLFGVQMLMVFSCLALFAQWLCYTLGKKWRKRKESKPTA